MQSPQDYPALQLAPTPIDSAACGSAMASALGPLSCFRFLGQPPCVPFRPAFAQNSDRFLGVDQFTPFGLRKPFGNVRGNGFAFCEHGRDYTESPSRRCSPRSARSNSSFCWVSTASSA